MNEKLMKVNVSLDTVVYVDDINTAQKVVIDNIADIIRQEQYDSSICWTIDEIDKLEKLPHGWEERSFPWTDIQTSDIRIDDILNNKINSVKKVSGYYAVILFLETGIIGTVQSEEPYDLSSKWDNATVKIIDNWKPILVQL